MKKLLFFISAIIMFGQLPVSAAVTIQPIEQTGTIKTYNLDITTAKTTVIVFPFTIQAVDRGSQAILAEKVAGADNVLKVKAARPGFEESNLTVITTDGKLYSFTVNYNARPSALAIDLSAAGNGQGESGSSAAVLANPTGTVRFSGVAVNQAQIQNTAKEVAAKDGFLHKKEKHNGIKLKLTGIYIKKDVLFYRYEVQNKSAVDYQVSSLRFFVRDKKVAKRTAVQEQEIQPIYEYRETGNTISGKGKQTIVVAFKKLTIADQKQFVTTLSESGGDRQLDLKIDGDDILKAQALPVPVPIAPVNQAIRATI